MPRSVTRLVHAYEASHFEPMVAIEPMKRGKNWPVKMEEFVNEAGDCMSDEEICNLWQLRGRIASARGTLLHFHAECHLNGLEIEKPHSPEFKNLLLLAEALREMGWMPFRTEVCLAHMGLCVQSASNLRSDLGKADSLCDLSLALGIFAAARPPPTHPKLQTTF